MILQYVKYLLLPLALFYGFIVYFRNKLYDIGAIKSLEFDFPVISIGNISFGGTGKTPHVEYLIRLLSKDFNLGILSRGYKRKTGGYILATSNSTAEEIGDEPCQMKQKFPHISIAVAESRSLAIPQLLSEKPGIDAILLDDGFQHREIHPGLSIILTRYSKLFTEDFILPVGTLREFRRSYKRSDFIIISKCPLDLTLDQRKEVERKVKPLSHQLIFYSYLKYHSPYALSDPTRRINLNKENDVLLFSGLASHQELKLDIEEKVNQIWLTNFPDHHYFDRFDLENIWDSFRNLPSKNKVLMTTEKDAVKLFKYKEWIIKNGLDIFVLPVTAEFFEKDKILFDKEIVQYLSRLKGLKHS